MNIMTGERTPLKVTLTPLQQECLEEAIAEYIDKGDSVSDWYLACRDLLTTLEKHGEE